MVTQQVIIGSTADPPDTASSQYVPINTNGGTFAPITDRHHPIPTGGSFEEINVKISNAPDTGKSYTFTLMVDGVASALAAVISDAETSETTTTSVSITAGQMVSLECDPTSTPDAISKVTWSLIWQPTTDDEYIYLGGHVNNALHNSNTEYTGLNAGEQSWGGSRSKRAQPMPTGGTLKKLAIRTNGASGVAKTYTFKIDKDGTGSTEEVVISNGDEDVTQINTNDFWTVTAGETYSYSCTPSGTPDASDAVCSCVFVPTTTGKIPYLGGGGDDAMNDTATEYGSLGEQNNFDGTRTNREVELVNVEMVFEAGYVKLNGTPGGTDSYTINFEVDAVDEATLQMIVGSGDNNKSVTGASVTVSAGEKINLEIVPTGTPTARTLQHGYLYTFGAAAPAPTFTPRMVTY